MGSKPRRRSKLTAALCCLVLALFPWSGGLPAVAATTYRIAFQTNENGGILTVGNNLLTCPDSDADCAAARSGSNTLNNNAFVMTNLDADADPTTFNSSSAQLTLPSDAVVLFAGLYWGARLARGSGGAAASGDQNVASFKTPTMSTYEQVTADVTYSQPESSRPYHDFADVTAEVQAAGSGTYWGADVVAATGEDRYAGWSLVVVYRSPSLPLRNLTVFDGFTDVAQGNPQTVTVSGFLTPAAGAVAVQLGMVAYEGDVGASGDTASLETTQLGTPLSPGSNFFNSTDDNSGVSVTARTPADRNMLGFDIKNMSASGIIANSATSATLSFTSTGDTYFPGVVTTAINLYAPDFTSSAKSVTDLTGNNPPRPGDTLQYAVLVANTGDDPSSGTSLVDTLPATVSYVTGSMVLVDPATATGTPLSDDPGDDVGTYDSSARQVTVNLGCGATATAGGVVASPSTTAAASCATTQTVVQFRVTLDDAAGGTTVSNVGEVHYTASTANLVKAPFLTRPASVQVAQVADVSIGKSLSATSVPAGGTVTATLTVTNSATSPNPAAGVVVTDKLPPGMTAGAITPASANCQVTGAATTGQTVTCTVGSLPVGASLQISVPGTVASGSTSANATDLAQVSTASLDPVLTNNIATQTATVTRSADLRIVKTPPASPAAPGSLGAATTFHLVATNLGPSDAQNVVVSDTTGNLSLFQLVAASVAGGTCSVSGSTVQCTLTNPLPAGQQADVTVTGYLSSGATPGTSVPDTATVSSSTPDPDTANNTDTEAIAVGPYSADVRVTKVTSPTPEMDLVAGGQVTYTITVTNDGPSDTHGTHGVTVTDTAPAGITFTGASTSRGSCTITGNALACDVGQLPAGSPGAAGASATITVTGTVAADATGDVTNSVTAGPDTSVTTDPNTANNTATETNAITQSVDLAVSKSANRASLPGTDDPRNVTYTITVTNRGPSAARDVTVTDAVPLVLHFVEPGADDADSGSFTVVDDDPLAALGLPAGATCDVSEARTPGAGGDADHGLLTCSLPGPIAPGASQQITVSMASQSNLAAIGDPVTETVQVSSPDESASATGDDESTWTLSGLPTNDLALGKTGPTTVVPGSTMDYTLVVTNNDVDEADPLWANAAPSALQPQVVDTLPAGLTFVSGTDCTAVGQVVTCQAPAGTDSIPQGDSETFTFTVRAAGDLTNAVSLVNTARVVPQASNPDPVPANNTASATTTVNATTDLTASKLITPADTPSGGLDATTGAPGSQHYFLIDVGNAGPAVAQNVSFVDTFGPYDVGVISDADGTLHIGGTVTDSGGAQIGTIPSTACTVLNGEIECALADPLPVGATAHFQIEIIVTSYAPEGVTGTDTVTATSSNPDADTANNEDSATLQVDTAQTDLEVTKTAVGAPFVAGQTFTYQIAVQIPGGGQPNGADAQDVRVTDTLPDGLVPTSASTTQGTCSIAGQVLTCDLGTVAGPYAAGLVPPVIVTVNGTIPPDPDFLGTGATADVDNTATARTSTADPTATCVDDAEDDPSPTGQWCATSSTVTAAVNRQADLQMFKSVDSATTYAGGTIAYTLTVVNAGPSYAENEELTDALPVGVTFTGTDPAAGAPGDPQCTVSGDAATGQTLDCLPARIEPLASVSFRVLGTVHGALQPADVPDGLVNTATVGGGPNDTACPVPSPEVEADPDCSNNTATATSALATSADLSISTTVDNPTPAVGGTVRFTTTVFDAGPSYGIDPVVTYTLPRGLQLVGLDPLPPYVDCAVGTGDPVVLTCTSTAPLDDLGTGHLDLTKIVPGIPFVVSGTFLVPEGTGQEVLTASGVISSATDDPNLANNATSAQIRPQIVADTSVVKQLLTDPLVAGQPVTWRLTATNAGPSVAPNVVYSDTLPAGTTFRSAVVETGTGSCTLDQEQVEGTATLDIVKCSTGALAVGATSSVLITVDTPLDARSITNTGSVGSGGLDPNSPDNASTVTAALLPPPSSDLATTIAALAPVVDDGAAAGFRVTVTNNGPDDATDVLATVEIPKSLANPQVAGATCTIAGDPTVTCPLGTLPVGSSVTFTITGTADLAAGGDLSARVTVSGSVDDPSPANDVATAVLAVNAAPGGGGALPVTGAEAAEVLALAVALLLAGFVVRALVTAPEPDPRHRRPGKAV